MSIKIKFTNPKNVMKDLEKEARRRIDAKIQQELKLIKCLAHNQGVEVTAQQTSTGFNYSVLGCGCEEVEEKVREILNS